MATQSDVDQFPGLVDKPEGWLKRMLLQTAVSHRDYFNHWKTGAVTMSEQTQYTYNFYFDAKYHWIVKHPNGQDQVVDPDLWAKIFGTDRMTDGAWYIKTSAVDAIYGELDLAIEVIWCDGMVKRVDLITSECDLVKGDVKRFHISLTQVL